MFLVKVLLLLSMLVLNWCAMDFTFVGLPNARSLIQPLGSVQGQDALGQLLAQALDTVACVYIFDDRP